MLNRIINIYKPVGLSPLDALKLFKLSNPKYKEAKMTYAGRLDPMAEGVLLALSGEKVFEKDKYLKLDKEYEAEIVFGFATDTHDMLGIPKQTRVSLTDLKKLKTEVENLVGDFSFSLPAYSSYKVKGKPLFEWARAGKLNEIEKVKRTTKIYSIKFKGKNPMQKIDASRILKTITEKINLVSGDFRQNKIKAAWQKTLEKSNEEYAVIKIKVNCSSGTYIRSLANELGKKLKTGAFLLSLKRSRVGEFLVKDSIVLK